MKKEKTGKIKTVRGSVLFTTVSVMALLIIFLTGALALASSANNRAHKSYASSQASYNARAAIDSFTQAMIDNPGVAAAVHDLASGSSFQPILSIGDNAGSVAEWDNAKGWGTIGYYDANGEFQPHCINVEALPNDPANTKYVWDSTKGENGEWVSVQKYKITATAQYGKEEETIVAYINTAINEESSISVKGLQLVGGSSFNTNDVITGGFGLQLRLKDNLKRCSFDNDFKLNTELAFINGDLDWKASAIYNAQLIKNNDTGKYEPSKMIVLGDLKIQTSNNSIVNVNYDTSLLGDSFTAKDVPLLYVDGMLTAESSSNEIVKSNGNEPFNVFAGSVDLGQGKFDADLYLMDEGANNRLGHLNTGNCGLYKWTSDISGKGYGSDGGNIYCNGNLELWQQEFHGDIRVVGNLTLHNQNITIDGDLVVGGNITMDKGFSKKLSEVVKGTVYVGGAVIGGAAETEEPTLKEGVELVPNILHENEAHIGYTCVGEYNNQAITVIADTSAATGPCKEHSEWHSTCKGNGTTEVCFGYLNGNEKTIYWSENYDTYYEFEPYLKADRDGNITGELTDTPKSAYYVDKDGNDVPESEAVGTYYTALDEPDVETTEEYSYYKNVNGAKVKISRSAAYGTTKIKDISAYKEKDNIYPANMTREAIFERWDEKESQTVPAPAETKLITTLGEARKALGLDSATGEIVESKINTNSILNASNLWDYKDLCPSDEADVVDLATCGHQISITNSVVIKGTSGIDGKRTIDIFPSEDLYVLFDNASFDNAEIVVHNKKADNKYYPTVTFIINGELHFNKGGIISESISEGCEVAYSDDFGIYYYGLSPEVKGDVVAKDDNGNPIKDKDGKYVITEGSVTNEESEITAKDNMTLVGCIKAPYTTYKAEVDPMYNVNYTDENGVRHTGRKGSIIGNALLKSAAVKNNFGLVYTQSGSKKGGGNSFYSAVGDLYQLMYYAAS